MRSLEEFLLPRMSFMHQHMEMRGHPHLRQELSRKTPVIDNLEGFPEFYNGIVDDVLTHNIVELFAIGKSGIGKGAVIEQTFRKMEDDKRVKGTRRTGARVHLQYYSLATEFQDAVRELGVVSPWGEFTPQELADAAEKAAHLGQGKLNEAEVSSEKPILRGMDFVAVSVPVDLGASLLTHAASRAKEDPSYTYRIVALKTDPTIQEETIALREDLWNLAEDTPPQVVSHMLRRRNVKPDTPSLELDKVRRGAGHPRGLLLVNELVNGQIYERQDEIREKVDRAFPWIESPSHLSGDSSLLAVGEDRYYKLLLFHDFGADSQKCLIVPNTFLKRQIPFYAKRLSQYRI